jgi:uncharacterized repeat protein (TIGR01451 family)
VASLALGGFLIAVMLGSGAAGAVFTVLDDPMPDAAPMLHVMKTAPEQIGVGSEFDYLIDVMNMGDAAATEVHVTDALPANVTLVSYDDRCTKQVGSPVVIVCNIASIEPQGSFSARIRVKGDAPGTVENTVDVSAANAGPESDTVTTVIGAKISIDKTGPATAIAGSRINYTIAVKNTGTVGASTVDLRDFLPAGASSPEFDDGCGLAEGTVLCHLGNIAASETRTVKVSFVVAAPGEITNRAQASASNLSPDPEDSVTTNVGPRPTADLGIDKSAPTRVDVDADFNYTIKVTNLGQTSMTGVTVRDPLPAGVTFKSAAGATCSAGEGVVDCQLGTVAVDSSQTFTITVASATSGMKVNTATVSSEVAETGGAPNSDSATTVVGQTMLIFGPTDTPALRQAVTNAGFVVAVVDASTWGEMTTAEFRAYRALLIGDRGCTGTGTFAAAVENASVWGAAVDGSVILDGTDPVLHSKNVFTNAAVRFAGSSAGRTGAYVSLSCAYSGAAARTPVPLLDAFKPGGFTATGVPGCFNDAHIVADHPALAGISDSYLSGWGCSVHEAFDSWPDDFLVLAIARNAGSAYTAPDGTVGTPYILARGEGLRVISNITLTTAAGNSNVGAVRTLSAKVVENDVAQAGKTVTFRVISGPHAGTNGTATTDETGTAVFSYGGKATGTDAIEATYVATNGTTQTSNRLFVTWVVAPPAPTTTVTASTAPSDSTAGMPRTVSATVTENETPQVGKTVTFRVVSGPHAGTNGTATTDGSGPAVFAYTGTAAGTDAIEASYVDSSGATKTSNQVFVTWVAAPSPPEPAPPAPTPAPPPGPAPPPDEPGTFNGQVVSGVVLFNGEPIRGVIQFESGDVIDATNGRIEIVTDSGRAEFFEGAFKLIQPTVDNAFTRIELVGGDFSVCSARKTAAAGADDRPVRRLWGKGTGKFETKARFSAATIRGTTWLVEDRCDGSLTHSEQGTVSVYDFSLRRVRVLTAGLDYLAEPPPPPTPGNFVGDVKGQVIVNGVPVEQDTQIRSGDTIDVRNGRIELTTTSGQASFFSGRFLVEQTGDSSAFTVLTLVGGDFSSCGTAAKSRSLSASAQDPPKKTVRSLWGTGKGKFQTKSRFSAATVRGTNWLTVDRCDGSLTVVREGLVEIYDITLDRTVQIGPGKQYLAPARRGG